MSLGPGTAEDPDRTVMKKQRSSDPQLLFSVAPDHCHLFTMDGPQESREKQNLSTSTCYVTAPTTLFLLEAIAIRLEAIVFRLSRRFVPNELLLGLAATVRERWDAPGYVGVNLKEGFPPSTGG